MSYHYCMKTVFFAVQPSHSKPQTTTSNPPLTFSSNITPSTSSYQYNSTSHINPTTGIGVLKEDTLVRSPNTVNITDNFSTCCAATTGSSTVS